jgi:hypothetical protein
MEVGHDTAGGLAQRDPAGEVHTVAQMAVGDVCGSTPGGDPGHGQGGGDDARPEPPDELSVGKETDRPECWFVRERRIEVDIHQS